jgi:hypothetical protein
MADGTTKRIKDVKVGDWVWAHDPETGETGPRQVIDTIIGDGEKQLVDIEVLGDTITATDGHPFCVDDQGMWVEAGDLEPGDRLLLANGSRAVVDATVGRVAVQRVHNLTVDGIHTYYVTADDSSVLVHNQSCVPRPRVKPNKPATPPSLTTNQGYGALTTDANPVAAATRIMDDFYPDGWVGRGAGSEFSQIQKWLSRNFDWS